MAKLVSATAHITSDTSPFSGAIWIGGIEIYWQYARFIAIPNSNNCLLWLAYSSAESDLNLIPLDSDGSGKKINMSTTFPGADTGWFLIAPDALATSRPCGCALWIVADFPLSNGFSYTVQFSQVPV